MLGTHFLLQCHLWHLVLILVFTVSCGTDMLFSTQRSSKLKFLTLLSGATDFNITVFASPWMATHFFLYLKNVTGTINKIQAACFPYVYCTKKTHDEKPLWTRNCNSPPWVTPQLAGLLFHGVYDSSIWESLVQSRI